MAIAALNNSNAAASAGASGLEANATDAAATADRFLKLLVAQMQNQDPLNPMDNAQVTTQMAQINTVSGIEKLNSTVSGLTQQFAQLQAMQAASLVGHSVVVPGDQLVVPEGGKVGAGSFELAGSADAVKVEVLDRTGRVVDTQQLAKHSVGTYSFTTEAPAKAVGPFSFRVTAVAGERGVPVTTLSLQKVQAVLMGGGGANGLQLQLESGATVSYSDVRSLS
jgi:flagellar basal-body rod modification protein FlgD